MPGITIRRSAASCASAARCRCPRPISRNRERDERHEVRELGPALPAPVPESARRVHQPARRLRGADRRRRECRHRARPGIDDDPDPLITAPLYGRWHALTQRLLTERDGTPCANPTNWVHKLNLDPRFRVPAGFGADVVEANAEAYMNDAWQQIGDVLAANQRIRAPPARASRSRRAGTTATSRRSPRRRRAGLRGDRAGARRGSSAARRRSRICAARACVPPVLTSTAMRRVVRPRRTADALACRSTPRAHAAQPAHARQRRRGRRAAPPKTVPPGVADGRPGRRRRRADGRAPLAARAPRTLPVAALACCSRSRSSS